MQEELDVLIKNALKGLGLEVEEVPLEHPHDTTHGDYATSVALQCAAKLSLPPFELADKIKQYIDDQKHKSIDRVEVAMPGFVNIFLTKEFFKEQLEEIINKGAQYGKSDVLKGEKVMVEHTDPNPFKEFHVGHLLPASIGSTIAKLFEWNGAEVKQASYQGDVGLHVAKALWGLQNLDSKATGDVLVDTVTLGRAYAEGHAAYESEHTDEIRTINKEIYEGSNSALNSLYTEWRQASLNYFEYIYKLIGIKFDYSFFEGETWKLGKQLVEENIGEIFVQSDGAIVFHAEKYDPSLHTRVFVNSEGLPTYEAKELGLAQMKFDKYPYTKSIVVTGNEINDYFKVLLAAMKFVLPELREKTKHISHGMLRLPTGKMSSRTGDVIPALALIESVKEAIKNKGEEPTNDIAIGAIKYAILRQTIGGDIIFDMEKSVSTEGDSGVYLQYAYARANSLLEKAGKKGDTSTKREVTHEVEKLLYIFPEIVERSMKEFAPSHITTYLTRLAGSFNNFYAHEQVIGDSPEAAYRLAIVEGFRNVMKNGLNILGIPTPERI